MPLDGIFLHFLANELGSELVGSRVEKVHQPSKDELLLLLRSRSGGSKLMLSASANCPRVHLTSNPPENPANPPMLCMLLRKHLCGAVVEGISQSGLDRTLFIDFDATNEIGDRVKLRLCVEIMAKHSNIILVNSDGIIIDAVKRVDMTQSSYRQILPSFAYIAPPAQDKLNLLETSPESVSSRVLSATDKQLSAALLATLEGASPLICREIAARACFSDVRVSDMTDEQKTRLLSELSKLRSALSNFTAVPYMLKEKSGKPLDFSFTDITQYGFSAVPQEYGSFSSLLDSFYYERDRLDRTRQRASDMVKVLSNATARISKKINLQNAELQQCAERENLRIKAELINASLGSLSKGALYYDIENYYDECKIIRIAADPTLSPAANAQKYYKEYRKAKTAEQMLTGLIENGMQELQYLDTVSDLLSRADTHAELDEIRAELEAAGYLKHHRKKAGKSPKPLPPMEYTSSDGFKIYVGRNNLQNDKLSLKTARGSDLWLHTQKIPGSHVIIQSLGNEIPPSTIEQAALLAAYHSKARESTLVPVDYTPAKNLKKPQGARPGKVIYHVYNTVVVNPSREAEQKISDNK